MSSAQDKARYMDEVIVLRRVCHERDAIIETLNARAKVLEAEVAKLDMIVDAFVAAHRTLRVRELGRGHAGGDQRQGPRTGDEYEPRHDIYSPSVHAIITIPGETNE